MKQQTKRQLVSRIGVASVALVTGLVVLGNSRAAEKSLPKLNVDSKPIVREGRSASFAPIVKKVAPSVVNIYSTQVVKETENPLNPFFQDPFFRRFFGEDLEQPSRPRRPRQVSNLGSGVVISEDGYILTNNHVVENAKEIKVSTDNDRKVFDAKVIGTDPATDIAVLKIDTEKNKIPAITVADSDRLEVGDIVLAIGNPFGVGQTVTMGIISATSRGGFGIVAYEDFIQTDASINPGNSGGALIDAEGRLIGINTAILSRSGGNMGVGFAVPINMARGVMEQIIKDGKVTRGFLGILPQDVSPELAQAFNLSGQQGALVGDVTPDSPADKAGLKDGDVIVSVNEKPIEDARKLRLMISRTPPGTVANLKVIRDGKEKEISVKLGELPASELVGKGRRGEPIEPEDDTLRGINISNLDEQNRRKFSVPKDIKGVLITGFEDDATDAQRKLSPGDVILEIYQQPVNDVDEAIEVSRKRRGDNLLLRVWSKGVSNFVVIENDKEKK